MYQYILYLLHGYTETGIELEDEDKHIFKCSITKQKSSKYALLENSFSVLSSDFSSKLPRPHFFPNTLLISLKVQSIAFWQASSYFLTGNLDAIITVRRLPADTPKCCFANGV